MELLGQVLVQYDWCSNEKGKSALGPTHTEAARGCFVCDELRGASGRWQTTKSLSRLVPWVRDAGNPRWGFVATHKGGPGANFVSSQPKFIKGSVELTCGWNPLRSLAARSLAVRSWKRTKKSSLVTPLNSLHTASPGQLISNGSDRAQSQGYCKITKSKCSASGLGAWKQWPFHLVSTLFLTISAVFSYLFSRCDQSLQS